MVTVSLNRQRLTVYDATQAIANAPISSGRRGRSTPTGVFSVVQKRRHHISNIYNVAMPNMQRLTWSGIALHAGALPGYPASSGCIRLSHGFSRQFFGMTKMGTRVIVTRDPVAPKMIAHERLFGAYPNTDVVANSDLDAEPTQVADASHAAGAASDAVAEVLGVSAAHASEVSGDESAGSTPRQRFLAQRAAEETERARAIRTAGYAWAGKRGTLTQVEREVEAKRAPFKAARAEAQRIEDELAEIEKGVARAEREIALLENPEPVAKSKRKARKARQKSLSAEERAARIDELRGEIVDAEPEMAALRTAAESASKALATAEAAAREADSKLDVAKAEAAEAKAALDRATKAEDAAKAREAKRDLPVSVFISRARQRLYVRQGYDDIFDVEVSFRDPEAPVGTHVFTALDYAPEIGGMSWSVVSVPFEPQRLASAKTQGKKGKQAKPDERPRAGHSAQTAAAALERIDIPEYAREAIADVMKPGSSVVISDLRMSNETGKYTDFIATIR
ncbi:hypothetical protein W911_02775 [Hyphomicrobium nitrativorans NL23]|uniref:L,D-TPase catalytic domain-containing protein n=1 Tax=Hyphomicrobium nitrativorans NL23 TaxID=1029756 RepID=V5SIH6_9HYPH|nr:hypothetical protein W911_02775 [Hyphomicrobium nitrativorans NL23]